MKNIILLFSILMVNTTFAQNESFSKLTFVNTDNNSLNYRLLAPENIKKGEKYPLVLFLHGAGE